MTNKDFTRLFYFIQQHPKIGKDLRWFLISLMSYQTKSGVVDETKRMDYFTVYFKKMNEWFEVNQLEFVSSIDLLTRNHFIDSSEIEYEGDIAYKIRINWGGIERYREQEKAKQLETPSASTIQDFNRLLQAGVITINNGKIVLKEEEHQNLLGYVK